MAGLTKVGIYSDGGGLYLRVRPSGRSWFYIGTLSGKRFEMSLAFSKRSEATSRQSER